MANVMQSLFGLELDRQQQAPITARQAISGMIERTGESLQQNIAGAFGQQTPRQALNSIIQRTQQEADLSTPEGLVALANNLNQLPQFAGMALALRQEAADRAQAAGLTSARTFQAQAAGTASLAQATRERRVPALDQARTIVMELAGRTDLNPEQQSALTNAREVLKLASQTINVGAKAEETEEAKEVGKGAGQQFTKVTTTDLDASEKRMNSIRELQVLSGQVATGAFAEVKAKAQSLFKDLGIDIGDPSDAQKLRAAIERGVAQSQLEQKGVQTDRDAARYRTASVLLTNTPAANEYIVNYQMALTERAREKARFFENFRQAKGTSVGAERAWQEEIKNKDIFDSPTLSKYKDAFKMNDLAKRYKNGTITNDEKKELAALMRKFGLVEVKIAQ